MSTSPRTPATPIITRDPAALEELLFPDHGADRTTALGTAILWTKAILRYPESLPDLETLSVGDSWDFAAAAERVRTSSFTSALGRPGVDGGAAFYPYLAVLPVSNGPIVHPDGKIIFPPSYWLELVVDNGSWSAAGLTLEAAAAPPTDGHPETGIQEAVAPDNRRL
jgi:hypothetical protein